MCILPEVYMAQLPIVDVIDDIRQALSDSDELVLEAPPGAGKTTQVPLSLLDEPWLHGQKILMLEPRRLAAKAAAERMAQVLGERVGETVGYRVRLDTRVGPNTRIEVVTDGILNRLLQSDPSLEGVGLVIFDEFHERSLDADLGLALTLQGRELFSDLRECRLKLLVMSATLNGADVSRLLGDAALISSAGKMYPVDIVYGAPSRFGERIVDRVVSAVLTAIDEQDGSVLVFLPGQGEIRRVHQQLQDRLGDQSGISLAPLYGDLSLQEQQRAIQPCQQNHRKIVLATNIAETSLTIEGVRVVIDSGLSREPAFDPNTAMTRLATVRISKASATQRAGRAGRLESGVCYRLWSESQHNELAAFSAPEMTQADLAPLALQLLNWGVTRLDELSWLDTPPAAAYEQALTLLEQLQAVERVDGQWRITAMGSAMLALSTHPRLAHMMVKAHELGCARLGCELAALLSERDPLSSGQGHESRADIALRLELLRGERKADRGQKSIVQRAKQLCQQFERQLKGAVGRDAMASHASPSAGLLLAFAYPDRLARRRINSSTTYQLSNGRAAQFGEADSLCQHEWLVVASLGGFKGQSSERIFLAIEVTIEEFERHFGEQIDEEIVVQWDDQQGKLIAEQRRQYGRLVLAQTPLVSITDDQRQHALLGLVRRRGLNILSWSGEAKQWRARVELMRSLDPDAEPNWPDVSDAGLLQTLDIWLLPYLSKVTRLTQLQELDTGAMLSGLLSWPQPKRLDEQLPLRYRVPSGSNIAIDYQQSPPVLAVKLQEMFGSTQTPSIAQGRIQLMLHLLSPAKRPLQVTQDLVGFWAGSYDAVKKEMKGRYPKHPWPDDPAQAIATAKTKAKM